MPLPCTILPEPELAPYGGCVDDRVATVPDRSRQISSHQVCAATARDHRGYPLSNYFPIYPQGFNTLHHQPGRKKADRTVASAGEICDSLGTGLRETRRA